MLILKSNPERNYFTFYDYGILAFSAVSLAFNKNNPMLLLNTAKNMCTNFYERSKSFREIL